jgi:septal ring factor EnvC (AmiA/AmiB activator)
MALPKNAAPDADSGAKTISSASKTGAPAGAAPTTASMIISRLNDVNTRLKLVEQRVNQNKERLRVFDDQIIENKKDVNRLVDEINDNIMGLRKNIKNIDDTIQHIIKELELTAKKQDINVIEKYVDMMDPTRYVTKEELKALLKK